MKKFNKVSILPVLYVFGVALALFLVGVILVNPVLAHRSPEDCTGSGLGISLFASSPQVHISDTISYSLNVLNGINSGPAVCDATDIQASLTTPDGVKHAIALSKTALSSGENISYPDVVTYVVRAQDIVYENSAGYVLAIASDTGTIHQNDTNSVGGGNQGVNTTIIPTIIVYIAPKLTVNKIVVNNNGGTKVVADFPLFLDGVSVISGIVNTTTAGMHTISETADSGYSATIGGDCAINGAIVLASGDVKTCNITNDDIAPPSGGGGGGPYYPPIIPIIDVVKVPVVVPQLVVPLVDGPPTITVVSPKLPNTGLPPEEWIGTSLMQSQIFFFISSIGFIILGLLTMVILIYILRALRVFSDILEKVEKDIDSIGDTTKEMLEDMKDSSIFRFIFKSNKKHRIKKH